MRMSDWSSDVCSSDLDMSKPDIVKDASDSEPIDTELLARAEMALLTLPRFTREVFLAHRIDDLRDRKSVVSGKGVSVRVELGGSRIIDKINSQYIDSEYNRPIDDH